MSTAIATQYLKDYQPSEFKVLETHLEFDIQEHFTRVRSVLKMERASDSLSTTPLLLNGEGLTLEEIAVNGALLSPDHYQLTDTHLTVLGLAESFVLTLTVTSRPDQNLALEGLYQSGDLLCTQCEPEGFRKITYYIDRPDVLSVFTVKIIADKERYPVLLSNGNCVAQGETNDGRHYAIWEDPFKKPCYLFALVAGPLSLTDGVFTTSSGREVKLCIYTRPEDQDKADYALEALADAMRWDEKVYGREYDLDVYMIVAVSDFNMGAMENKGLNVFNTKYVLVSQKTATDVDYRQVQAVIGHEYFHNWTGNRVTCRDWFQLSLKEGLTVFRDQQFTADHHSPTVKRIQDVRIIRSAQFSEDASPMAHPVRPASYVEINNFYTVTVYNKGAEVIRMLHTLMGVEGFRKGMDLYFKRHDGQAVTCDDFVAAIADANHQDLTQFKRWYSQAGTPIVKVTEHYEEAHHRYTLNFSQTCPSTADGSVKYPFVIPIKMGLLGQTGRALTFDYQGQSAVEQVVLLTQAEQSIVFENMAEHPVPSLLRDFSAPIKLETFLEEAQLIHLFEHDVNAFNRFEAGQILMKRWLWSAMAASSSEDYPSAEHLVRILGQLLKDADFDSALMAEMMIPPLETVLMQEMEVIDVEALHRARSDLLDLLAKELAEEWLAAYERCHSKKKYARDARSVGQRQLKNVCLSYLIRRRSKVATELAHSQFEHADNMTDQLAALGCLMNGHNETARAHALKEFYQEWKSQALVMDKWLAIQASADLPDVIERVESLLSHPIFVLNNPNKVYALLGTFAANHAHFHAADGRGYRLIAQQIIQLSHNPQVSARLVRSLMSFRRYDSSRQKLMQEALQSILDSGVASKDVIEIITKALK